MWQEGYNGRDLDKVSSLLFFKVTNWVNKVPYPSIKSIKKTIASKTAQRDEWAAIKFKFSLKIIIMEYFFKPFSFHLIKDNNYS